MNLLFELIKKRLPFKDLISKLYSENNSKIFKTKVQITNMNLFCLLLDNCSSELRIMLFLACSSYMPVPLIANRPYIDWSNLEEIDEEELKIG